MLGGRSRQKVPDSVDFTRKGPMNNGCNLQMAGNESFLVNRSTCHLLKRSGPDACGYKNGFEFIKHHT